MTRQKVNPGALGGDTGAKAEFEAAKLHLQTYTAGGVEAISLYNELRNAEGIAYFLSTGFEGDDQKTLEALTDILGAIAAKVGGR
jgi:hypothetical protein